MSILFQGKSLALSEAGLDAAAQKLSVARAEVLTVLAVETSGCGFLPDRRPQILFERHLFCRLTGGACKDPDISNPVPGGYGPPGGNQYIRLAKAIDFDRAAALQSASWGLGQIMGENYKMCGFSDVESMVTAMVESEDAQITAFALFVASSNLADALREHNWPAFAARYNGPAYASNQYDVKLAQAFAKYSEGNMPDLDTRTAQLYLTFLGQDPGPIDGTPGARTRAAIIEFQQKHNLPATGELDEELLALLLTELTIN